MSFTIDGKYAHKKSIHGFFLDRRFAKQISALLSRHPWLDEGWQVRAKKKIPPPQNAL